MNLLPTSRAPFAIELIAYAMLTLVPSLTLSLVFARTRRYLVHKNIQMALSIGLLLVIVTFEMEVRMHGWTQWAKASPYFDGILFPFLYSHVTIATLTTILWIVTISKAVRRFPVPPRPGIYSTEHKRLARIAAVGMFLTATTGWAFFWMAFVAK